MGDYDKGWIDLEEIASIFKVSPNALMDMLIDQKIRVKFQSYEGVKNVLASHEVYEDFFYSVSVHIHDLFEIIKSNEKIFKSVDTHFFFLNTIDFDNNDVLLHRVFRDVQDYKMKNNKLLESKNNQINTSTPSDVASEEISLLRLTNERLTKELEQLKAEPPVLPKTAPATEKKIASDVERWKGQAVVMAKVAYQCGLEDRREVIRKDFETLAVKHGGLSKTGIDLLRGAIPEVAKTTPGASRQK